MRTSIPWGFSLHSPNYAILNYISSSSHRDIICYNVTMNGIFIHTTSRRQRELWQYLFQADMLPIISRTPDLRYDAYGRATWYYMLDAAALSIWQVRRLTNHVQREQAKRGNVEKPESIMSRVYRDGFPIDAEFCEVVETAVSSERPSLFARRWQGAYIGVT